jgi:hypothetical protein
MIAIVREEGGDRSLRMRDVDLEVESGQEVLLFLQQRLQRSFLEKL